MWIVRSLEENPLIVIRMYEGRKERKRKKEEKKMKKKKGHDTKARTAIFHSVNFSSLSNEILSRQAAFFSLRFLNSSFSLERHIKAFRDLTKRGAREL